MNEFLVSRKNVGLILIKNPLASCLELQLYVCRRIYIQIETNLSREKDEKSTDNHPKIQKRKSTIKNIMTKTNIQKYNITKTQRP